MLQLQEEHAPMPIPLPNHHEPPGFPPNHIQEELLPLEPPSCKSSQPVSQYNSRERDARKTKEDSFHFL